MFDDAMPNTAPELMVRRGGLNQTLYEETPRFGMAFPNFLPRLMRIPILTGVEQRHAFGKIGAIFVSELRREPARAERGRRQAVRVRRFR